MRSQRIAPALALGALVLALALPAAAQQTRPDRADANRDKGGGFESRQALESYYDDQFLQLDRRRIGDLADLAEKLPADQAETTYQEIFNLAVARDLYDAAEPAAEAYLSKTNGDPRTLALATFVNVIAAANKGDYQESLARLGRFLAASGRPGEANAAQLDPTTTYAVGEAFIQKLIRDGKYDVAKKAANLFVDKSADKQVQQHFASRLERINMLGKPAPPIAGKTIDGDEVSLADLKGKVVLLDFWASWAPPCVASLPQYNSLYEQYKDKGFAVLGINLDAMHERIRANDRGRLRSGLRDFLVQMRIGWPVVMNGSGDQDFARAYGVTEIPTNFLIGPDGRITHVELTGPALETTVAELVGDKGEGGKAARPAANPRPANAPAANPAGAGEKVKLPRP